MSAAKFHYIKTLSGNVVAQSIAFLCRGPKIPGVWVDNGPCTNVTKSLDLHGFHKYYRSTLGGGGSNPRTPCSPLSMGIVPKDAKEKFTNFKQLE